MCDQHAEKDMKSISCETFSRKDIFFRLMDPSLTLEIWGLGGWFCGGVSSSCRLRCPWTSQPGGRGWFYGLLSAPHTAGLERSTPSGYNNTEPGCTHLWKEEGHSDSKEKGRTIRGRWLKGCHSDSFLTWKWWYLGAWVCAGVWSRSLWCPALSLQPLLLRAASQGRRPPAPRCPPTAGQKFPQKESPRTLNTNQRKSKLRIKHETV